MTRPNIIRADTIDLQHHDVLPAENRPDSALAASAPSFAPHQADTLRGVAHETAREEARGPRLSWTGGKGRAEGNHHPARDTCSDTDAAADMHQHANHQHDALAEAQNGRLSSSDEGDLDADTNADADADLDEDIMDKISSSPSIEDEDIDFEFVYALHTFVATVEGQANATKGDTMVLLDDSNSYWWLVRVVKDSSIGYLPAEHIETPTERLARLNKHRNIDLSATMLGDQAQKQKSSFKAIRRRRKNVTFAEPTYVDYSDFDYSTDEDDDLFGTQAHLSAERHKRESAQRTSAEAQATDDGAKVEPLRTRPGKEEPISEAAKDESADVTEDSRDSDELVEGKPDGPSRSRHGTVRNTDSFFKDESVETKKITLTPNLLRDDNTPRESSESLNRELKTRSSLDKMDRELVTDKEKEKKKIRDKDKKDKDKKPSAIRNFFSRKDKKKTTDDDDDSFGKRSMDTISESRDSDDRSEEPASVDKPASASRSPGKLQKPGSLGNAPPASALKKPVELASYLTEGRTNDVSNVPPASMRIVDPETQQAQEVPSNQQRVRSLSAAVPRDERHAVNKVIPARSSSTAPDSRLRDTAKTKAHVNMDGSDSSDPEELPDRAMYREAPGKSAPVKGQEDESEDSRQTPASENSSTPQSLRKDTAGRARASSGDDESANPPALVVDTSSPEGDSPETSPSPDQGQVSSVDSQRAEGLTGREPPWDDSKLRAFFDEPDHIRDLLVVVYDKTNVEPAGNDHPVVGGLFREQNAKLAEITTQLDNMLGDWLSRKQRLRGMV